MQNNDNEKTSILKLVCMIILFFVSVFNSAKEDKNNIYKNINNYEVSLYKKDKDGNYIESCKSISFNSSRFSKENKFQEFITAKECTNEDLSDSGLSVFSTKVIKSKIYKNK